MHRPVRVLELRSVRGTGGGPEKTILTGAALSDPTQYAISVCYIRDRRDSAFLIDRRAAESGVDYVEVTEKHSFDYAVWPALRRIVRERRIDVVHAHDYKTNFYAWLLGKYESVVPMTTLHGYTGHSWRERVYYAMDKRLVSRFPLVVAVSEDLRQTVIRAGARPERVVRVLNGIDDRMFRRDPTLAPAVRTALGLRQADVVIAGVGRLERQKRFDLLMQAFADARRRTAGVPLRLVIVGEGSERQRLEEDCARLGLGDDCRFLGQRSDVAWLHCGFDLLVQSSDYEGTPNAVLEAMALETPVIATDVGGTAELIKSGVHGRIVPAGDARALADAIFEAVSNPSSLAPLARAARARVEQELSFRARMRAIERWYDCLAGADAATVSS
jgi:glycosyltransferase involved in cell wall biosynthesis